MVIRETIKNRDNGTSEQLCLERHKRRNTKFQWALLCSCEHTSDKYSLVGTCCCKFLPIVCYNFYVRTYEYI